MMEVSERMQGRRLKGCGIVRVLVVMDFSLSFLENR